MNEKMPIFLSGRLNLEEFGFPEEMFFFPDEVVGARVKEEGGPVVVVCLHSGAYAVSRLLTEEYAKEVAEKINKWVKVPE